MCSYYRILYTVYNFQNERSRIIFGVTTFDGREKMIVVPHVVTKVEAKTISFLIVKKRFDIEMFGYIDTLF